MTQQEKDIELYKASLPAFFTNELEADKTILGLSVAAIGFFMALFLNKDIQITAPMFITIIIALISFLIVSSMIIAIFIRNKKQLLHIVQTTGGFEEDTLLEFLDRWKYLPFVIGIVFSIIFTLSLMHSKINDQGKTKMSTPDEIQKLINSGAVSTHEGVSGVVNANLSKGFSGAVNANTATSNSTQTQQQQQQPQQQQQDTSGDTDGK